MFAIGKHGLFTNTIQFSFFFSLCNYCYFCYCCFFSSNFMCVWMSECVFVCVCVHYCRFAFTDYAADIKCCLIKIHKFSFQLLLLCLHKKANIIASVEKLQAKNELSPNAKREMVNCLCCSLSLYLFIRLCVRTVVSLGGNRAQVSADKILNIFFVWNLYVMSWRFDFISFFIVDKMPHAIAFFSFARPRGP